jgi:hypothetical protein
VLEKLVQAIEEAKVSIGEPVPAAQGGGHRKLSLFQGTGDWVIAADLPPRRNYPDMIASTGLRPDIVVTSIRTKVIVIIELTVPYESNMSGSHEFKLAKYEDLVAQLHRQGYKTHLFAVEVGARGFAGTSVYNLLKRLGLASRRCAWYIKQVTEAAERASYWIWLKRNDKTGSMT